MSIIGNPIMAGASGPAASIFVNGLSQTDTVTATKGTKTLTGKWTQKPNPVAHGLPDGYTELEYITSTGSQYINTGVSVDGLDFTVEIVGKMNSTARNKYIFGNENIGMGINTYATGSEWSFDGKSWKATSTNATTLTKATGKAGSTSTTPLVLFAHNWKGSIVDHATAQLNYIAFYNNSGLKVFEAYPCKRNSDGVIGMYDIVSDTFLMNSGSGTFGKGIEIPQTIDGFLIKPIRDFGTWTVTATDGTDTYTQDVFVDVITEYEIEITKKLYLYRDGDECEDVTGGWESVALMYVPNTSSLAPTITRNSNNMVARISGEVKGGIIRCANTVNLTNYKKLYFTGSLALNGNSTAYVRLCVWDKLGSTWNENVVVEIKANGTNGTFYYENSELDVSNLNGNHIIGFGLYSSQAANNDYAQVTLNSIYLE